MTQYATPGLYYERVDYARKGISAIRTDIPGFVGITEKGPVNKPARIESWRQFQSVFGGIIPQSYLAYAVKGFFENGGDICYVVRIADIEHAKKAFRIMKDVNGNLFKITAVNEGRWGNEIRVSIRETGASSYTFIFSFGDDYQEVFKNISLDPAHDNYIKKENAIGSRSNLVKLEEPEPEIPINEKPFDLDQFGQAGLFLENGVDGISSITRKDFTGDASGAERKIGLRCYEEVDEVSTICIPDIMIQPLKVPSYFEKPKKNEKIDPCALNQESTDNTESFVPGFPLKGDFELPPKFFKEDILAVQQAMKDHCEKMKYRFAILGSPFDTDLPEIRSWREQLDSKYAALYYPWIRVDDPLRLNNEVTRLIPPCGHIAGIYARNDLSVGVHKAPANEEIKGARDVAVSIESSVQDVLNPDGINCLRVFPGRGVMVWGARTISSDLSWRFINVRRLLNMIEESVEEAMQWAVFEPNDFYLRTGVRISVSGFLEQLWRNGALAGAFPEEAYFIKCNEDNNPQKIIDEGKLITEIGVAPAIPAEFVIFRIGKVEDRMEVVEEE